MEDRFQAEWVTIPQFAYTEPRCMYHKENAYEGQSDGCTAGNADSRGNLHVLARAEYMRETEKTGQERTQVCLRITADDYYKLYINGKYAGQGPAPAYPEHYYYNEINITPFLHEGRNILAVHLYYQGLVNRVWNSGDGRFGLAAEIIETGRGGKQNAPEASAGSGTEPARKTECRRREPLWKYQICHAFSGDPTGYDTQYLENFDSRRWEENWREESFDDSTWAHMVKMQKADYCCSRQPTDMLSVTFRQPELIRKTPQGWFIDMGEEITGALTLRAESEKDGGRIRIRCGEELEDNGQVRFQMRCGCNYEEIWTLRQGECRLEPYDYKGFRYAHLLCGPGTRITGIEAAVRHYPMDATLCTLHTEESVLDQIFTICKNAVKYGTQEGYLDCPTREKGQYLGDAIVSARAQVWLSGDVRMLRKCISQFAQTAQICPGLMAVAPGSYMQEVADFSLMWPQLLMTDYQFTGDRKFLRQYLPTVKGILRHFQRYARPDGLLEQVADKWNLVDWPENLRDGYDFELSRPVVAPGCHNVINALYIGAVKTLEQMEDILKEPGDPGQKEGCAGLKADGRIQKIPESGQLKNAFIQAFYSEKTGLFRDSEESLHSALHSNIYPLLFGLCPEGSKKRISDFLIRKGLCCGVLTGYFYLKALAAAGRYDELYRVLVNRTEHGWANMIREGATACWEAWGKDQKWNTSLCHPWASGPVPVIIEDIAGFVPDPAEEEGFRFEPHIPEAAGSFELRVPFRGKEYVVRDRRIAILPEKSYTY